MRKNLQYFGSSFSGMPELSASFASSASLLSSLLLLFIAPEPLSLLLACPFHRRLLGPERRHRRFRYPARC